MKAFLLIEMFAALAVVASYDGDRSPWAENSYAYNVCPEPFYFYDYNPLIASINDNESKQKLPYAYEYDLPKSGQQQQQSTKSSLIVANSTILKVISPSKYLNYLNLSSVVNVYKDEFLKRNNQFRKKFQSQLMPDEQGGSVSYPLQQQMQGPIWQIVKQTYDKCCPLNRERLKPAKLKDNIHLYQSLFEAFANQTSLVYLHGQGLYGVVELRDDNHQFDLYAFSAHTVKLISSSGFYLIAKRELNGAPTMMPIALSTLIGCWPLLAITLIANILAGIFFWFLDKALRTRQFSQEFVKGSADGFYWSFILFTSSK